MRLGDYFRIAAGDLRRQPLRSSLTIVALVISTVILISMIALSIGGRQAITNQYGSGDALSTITVTANQAGSGLSVFGSVQTVTEDKKLTDDTARELATIPHVSGAVARAHLWELRDFTIDSHSKQFVAQAEGIPSDDRIALAAGRHFSSNDETNVVIVGRGYAHDLGLEDNPQQLVGKAVQITTQPGYRGVDADIPPPGAPRQQTDTFAKTPTTLTATIVGVTDTGADQNNLLVPMGWAHQIRTARNGDSSIDQLQKDGYTSINVSVDDNTNVAAVSKAITERGFGQFSAKTQLEKIDQLTAILWLILGTVALIAALAAALGITNTMLMAASEQRYVIGIWRAVGARRRTIVVLFLIQAAIMGIIGGMVGAALAYAASFWINSYAASLLAAEGLATTNIADVTPWLVAAAITFTTLFGMLAGLYPAIKAARQDPSDALRSGQ